MRCDTGGFGVYQTPSKIRESEYTTSPSQKGLIWASLFRRLLARHTLSRGARRRWPACGHWDSALNFWSPITENGPTSQLEGVVVTQVDDVLGTGSPSIHNWSLLLEAAFNSNPREYPPLSFAGVRISPLSLPPFPSFCTNLHMLCTSVRSRKTLHMRIFGPYAIRGLG